MELGFYIIIGKLFILGSTIWTIYKLTTFVFERLFNLIAGRFRLTFYFLEFLTYRKDFKVFVKDKKRHYKIEKLDKDE